MLSTALCLVMAASVGADTQFLASVPIKVASPPDPTQLQSGAAPEAAAVLERFYYDDVEAADLDTFGAPASADPVSR